MAGHDAGTHFSLGGASHMQRVQFMSYSEEDAVTRYVVNVSQNMMRKKQRGEAKGGLVLRAATKCTELELEEEEEVMVVVVMMMMMMMMMMMRKAFSMCVKACGNVCKNRVLLSGITYSRAKSDHPQSRSRRGVRGRRRESQ